jgi:hypothetical protein
MELKIKIDSEISNLAAAVFQTILNEQDPSREQYRRVTKANHKQDSFSTPQRSGLFKEVALRALV